MAADGYRARLVPQDPTLSGRRPLARTPPQGRRPPPHLILGTLARTASVSRSSRASNTDMICPPMRFSLHLHLLVPAPLRDLFGADPGRPERLPEGIGPRVHAQSVDALGQRLEGAR